MKTVYTLEEAYRFERYRRHALDIYPEWRKETGFNSGRACHIRRQYDLYEAGIRDSRISDATLVLMEDFTRKE